MNGRQDTSSQDDWGRGEERKGSLRKKRVCYEVGAIQRMRSISHREQKDSKKVGQEAFERVNG